MLSVFRSRISVWQSLRQLICRAKAAKRESIFPSIFTWWHLLIFQIGWLSSPCHIDSFVIEIINKIPFVYQKSVYVLHDTLNFVGNAVFFVPLRWFLFWFRLIAMSPSFVASCYSCSRYRNRKTHLNSWRAAISEPMRATILRCPYTCQDDFMNIQSGRKWYSQTLQQFASSLSDLINKFLNFSTMPEEVDSIGRPE